MNVRFDYAAQDQCISYITLHYCKDSWNFPPSLSLSFSAVIGAGVSLSVCGDTIGRSALYGVEAGG